MDFLAATSSSDTSVQKALKSAYATLYASKKARTDLHPVGCHCEDCDWVSDYEHDMMLKDGEGESPEFVY